VSPYAALDPLGQLVGQLVTIITKAVGDRNASHEAILAEAQVAIDSWHVAVGALDADVAKAREATDLALKTALDAAAKVSSP